MIKLDNLQKKAVELGIEYEGVEKKALEKLVKAKEKELQNAEKPVETPAEVEQPKVEEKVEEVKTEEKVEEPKVEENPDATVAIVYKDGKYEIRRYTKEIHGEDFKSLADQFATKNHCFVVLE